MVLLNRAILYTHGLIFCNTDIIISLIPIQSSGLILYVSPLFLKSNGASMAVGSTSIKSSGFLPLVSGTK
jgi:hypothetical protein